MTATNVTYAEVGATLAGVLPSRYHHVERRVVVGADEGAFRRLADAVMGWGIQRGAGLEMRAGAERVAVGVDVTCVTRLGPVRVPVPCRVVGVVDEPARVGFAYGTLPGHPECGEEAFLAEWDAASGEVRFVVRAFSRPGTWWSKLGAPVTKLVQRRVTERYLRAGRASAG